MAQTTMDFSWRVRHVRDRAVVTAEGELDVYWAPGFRDSLVELVEGRGVRELAIDLGGVTFVDSTGLGVLIGIQRRLVERGGSLVLSNPSRSTTKALEVSGLLPLFDVAI